VDHDLLPPEIWDKIKKTNALSMHQLERDKAYIEIAIAGYRRQRSARREERRLVGQTRDAATKAVYLLSKLVQDQAFLFIGTADHDSVSATLSKIVHAAEALDEIEREMDNTLNRFDRAGEQLIFPEYGALEEFVFDLLMTHATSLEIAPPTDPHQSFLNPGFLELVHLCASAADPYFASGDKKARKKIDRAIVQATRSYAKVRMIDPAGWKRNWENRHQS
jgi:hypothetical protein